MVRISETTSHSVGLRRSWWGQSVFNAEGRAERVELMLSRCSALAQTEKAVGELLAIIGQNSADTDRTRTFEVTQKAPGIGGCLVAIDGNEDPAGGPVDRHKEISSRRLIGHARQVFYVNVDVSGFVDLDTTVLRVCFKMS